MKKYIQPSIEVVSLLAEGGIMLTLSGKTPEKDSNFNQFSNVREAEDWDDEEL